MLILKKIFILNKFIRQKKRELTIILSKIINEELAIYIYKFLFNTKNLKNNKLGKLLLIIIARKGIKKKVISSINIEGNKLNTNILDYAVLTKALGFGIDPLPPIIRCGGDIFIDVGCHIGYYSLMAGNYFHKIYSIDASKSRARECKENSIKLNFSKKIETFNYALGDYDSPKELKLYENPYNSGGSFTTSEEIFSSWEQVNVPCTNLDELLLQNLLSDKNFKRILLKVDVEGYELKVIKGAFKIIKKFRPIILVEGRPEEEYIKLIKDNLPENYLVKTASSFLYNSINPKIDTDLVCIPIKKNIV